MKPVGVIVAQLTPRAWRQSEQGQREINKARSLLMQSGIESVQINENCFEQGRLPDIYPSHGLLSAIHAAAFFDPERHVMMVAADMPLITTDMLRWLMATGSNHHCSCHFRSSSLPLYFHNDDFSRDYLEQLLSNGEPVKDDLRGLSCIELVAPYESHLTRLNLSRSAE
ncbi:NTP transferase domain-containing protein [Lacimicrobium alkaliphilum]|uniref:MobA-like NTP transferase domain-containing protein n=1 Tax=Lacimicrobium alkaliphilum TaxID=1526571 RepID=A0A0U2ZI72_9ALTE|nr:NTP transferase domain-containing protein [Lacimicrobium alkaliphilum]ALS98044.1 hypothetical protein AT746_07050 [Lacimicrobium alkaliphilum]